MAVEENRREAEVKETSVQWPYFEGEVKRRAQIGDLPLLPLVDGGGKDESLDYAQVHVLTK